MATNWVVPIVADISDVFAQPAIDKAAGIGAIDTSTKLANILALVVARVRNTIANNSRGHQVSMTAGSVPPESKQFVLVMAARQLVDSIPGMSATIADGENFKSLNAKAEDWIKAVSEGASVSSPTDPDPATVAGPDGAQNYVDLSTDAA
jgi:hypothetical protein